MVSKSESVPSSYRKTQKGVGFLIQFVTMSELHWLSKFSFYSSLWSINFVSRDIHINFEKKQIKKAWYWQ